nr:isocitrate lyase [Verrucomicrobiota bacterium]
MSNTDATSDSFLDWQTDPRWSGVERCYSLSDVRRLQGSVRIEQT